MVNEVGILCYHSLCNVYCFFVNLSVPNFQILFYEVSLLFAQTPRFVLVLLCVISPFDFLAVVVWFSFLCCYTLLFLSRIILFCLLL